MNSFCAGGGGGEGAKGIILTFCLLLFGRYLQLLCIILLELHNNDVMFWPTSISNGYACLSDKFLAFKTPLGPRYDDEIPEANRFQLPMLFAYLQSLKVRVYSVLNEIWVRQLQA